MSTAMATNVTTISPFVETINTKVVICTAAAFVAFIAWLILQDRTRNFPDGPRGLPLLGNMLSMNDGTLLHLKLTGWSQKYGDFYAYMMGRAPVIVLSSHQAINDLFVKRGSKYSSRPKASNQASIITQDARIVAIPYGDQWRVSYAFSLCSRHHLDKITRNIGKRTTSFSTCKMPRCFFHTRSMKADGL